MPPRLRVSGLCPRCPQQGALNDVQPDGEFLALGGSRERNLSTTSVIYTVYYLYNTLSIRPTLRVPEADTTNVLYPITLVPVAWKPSGYILPR